MSLKIAHVDDSSTSRLMVRKILSGLEAEASVVDFESATSLLRALEAGAEFDLILTDWNMPTMSGFELLLEVKRHPRWRWSVVALVSAEASEENVRRAKSAGALRFVAKPLNDAKLAPLLRSARERSRAFEDYDESFAAESVDSLEEARRALAEGSDGIARAMRALHTIKGNASSLQLPILADALHRCEDALRAAPPSAAARAGLALEPTLAWLRSCFRAIEHGLPHDLPPAGLLDAAEEAIRSSAALADEGGRRAERAPAPGDVDGGRSASVRVATRKLDDLRSKIKSVQQARARLASRLRLVAQEFDGEPFVAELERASAEIGEAAAEAMEFFLEFRLTSLSRLARFAERCASEAASETGRRVDFAFVGDEAQQIDGPVVEILERAALHVVRNAVDHGGRDRIRIEMRAEKIGASDRDGAVRVELSDDGNGVDFAALRKKVAGLGLLSQDAVDSMEDDKLLDFIFVDGVTTRDEATRMSGRGVGLAAVRAEIVEAGGSIRVESGRGVRFVVEMPRRFKL